MDDVDRDFWMPKSRQPVGTRIIESMKNNRAFEKWDDEGHNYRRKPEAQVGSFEMQPTTNDVIEVNLSALLMSSCELLQLRT